MIQQNHAFAETHMIASLQLQYSQSLSWVIGVVVILSLLILLIYPGQLRQIPARWRWILPLLRILAVASIALSVLRPVVTRPRVSSERAPVVIVLDNSRSMSVIDTSRPPAEWVGIAASLAKLPASARDKQTQAIQADCDLLSTRADDLVRCRAEFDYARLSGRGEDTARARLDQSIADLQSTARDAGVKTAALVNKSNLEQQLDRQIALLATAPVKSEQPTWLDKARDRAQDAAKIAEQARFARDAELFKSDPQVREGCLPLQSLNRLQLAESVVFDSEAGLIPRLGVGTPMLGYGISDRVTPIAVNGHPRSTDTLTPDGVVTNLTGGIRAVLDSLSAAPPRAVVLFSDGRQTMPDPDASALQGVPIFTVAAATHSRIRDLTITNVTVPSSATVGETVALHAELRASGLPATETNLTITGGGDEEFRPVNFLDSRNGTVTVPINVARKFTEPGAQRITLELASVADEISYDNNHVERTVNVQLPIPRSATHPADAGKPPPAKPSSADEIEMTDLTGDEPALRHLAESSGGQFFRIDQIDLLARRLNQIHDDVNHPVEIPLWDGPWLVTLVLGCLAAEWGLRKKYGLA